MAAPVRLKQTMERRADGITAVPLEHSRITEIAAIESRCFSDPWSEASFASAAENGMYSFYTAIDPVTGKVCGYGGIYTVCDSADVTTIAVLPEYRGRGIGSLLLDALINTAVRRGAEQIHLEVRESNSPAISLYKKHGFTEDGRRRGYYRFPKEDAILMTLHPDKDSFK